MPTPAYRVLSSHSYLVNWHGYYWFTKHCAKRLCAWGLPWPIMLVDEVFYSFLLFSIQPYANRIEGDLQKYAHSTNL